MRITGTYLSFLMMLLNLSSCAVCVPCAWKALKDTELVQYCSPNF